ncbi:hypothetical protein [Thomasclavelia saccharogumia]|uniref:hypothetical protein n=1 Tax=Thomasclavelia saccharogumia TaxID=341225 RepID=UPI00047DC31D|nr:hypothetical protein [Thomasclavelia saccharogumia]
MISFKIKLANKVIEVATIYSMTKKLCKDYLSQEKADFSIKIEENDIDNERIKSKEEDERQGINIRNFSNEYLETLAVYRKIATQMPQFNVLLFHGSVIAVDNKGYLFTAPSGTGKSTHTRLWMERFKNRAYMVNDDKPLLKIDNDIVTAYGTPWDGKHRLSTNTSVSLQGICILYQAKENTIKKINKKDALMQILQQTYRPLDNPQAYIQTLNLIDQLLNSTPVYKMGCNISQEAVNIAYEAMKMTND